MHVRKTNVPCDTVLQYTHTRVAVRCLVAAIRRQIREQNISTRTQAYPILNSHLKQLVTAGQGMPAPLEPAVVADHG